jgi:hypothetical protein
VVAKPLFQAYWSPVVAAVLGHRRHRPRDCNRIRGAYRAPISDGDLLDPLDRDAHITLAKLVADPSDTRATKRVIVEITPRFRAIRREAGVDWTTDTLKKRLAVHWVKLLGWMLFDSEHACESKNSSAACKTQYLEDTADCGHRPRKKARRSGAQRPGKFTPLPPRPGAPRQA